MRIACFGCTGLIGQPLVAALQGADHEVTVFARTPSRATQVFPAGTTVLAWAGDGPVEHPGGSFDAAINLIGENLAAKRWSTSRKATLVSSRIDTTTLIARWAGESETHLVNASAVGFYGQRDEACGENATAGSGFLADLCRDWEAAAAAVDGACLLRFGAVLAAGGGALGEMVRPLMPLARLGHGRQPFPWIHVDDAVGMIVTALGDRAWSGPVNAVSGTPIDHRTFMHALATATGKPLMPMSVPGWALRLMLGEMATMLLTGAPVLPQRATELGYAWKHGDVSQALGAIFGTETL